MHNESKSTARLDQRSIALRKRVLDVLNASRRGHLGASFSLVEILRVLYDDILHFDSDNPSLKDRDRCILSKGHGCITQYVMLAEKGFFPEFHLTTFCRDGGILGGHPDANKIPGCEVSTGSLGHGLSVGVGMALALRASGSPARVFVVLGDGESNEGSVWEAAMSAGKHRLENLVVLVDYNKYQSYDATKIVQDMAPFVAKWKTFGFAATEVDGHNVQALRSLLSGVPLAPGRPSALVCHTVKGRGIAFCENNLDWHHKARISDQGMQELYAGLEQGE